MGRHLIVVVLTVMCIIVINTAPSEVQGKMLQTTSRSKCYSFDCDLIKNSMLSDRARREAKIIHAPLEVSSFFDFFASYSIPPFLQKTVSLIKKGATSIRDFVECVTDLAALRSKDDALDSFEALSRSFVAQPRALEQIRTIIRSHLIKGGPTALHLVGDNGLGKTTMAKMISLAFYNAPNAALGASAGSGLLHINCLEVRARDQQSQLIATITAHLKKNPISVILIDDLQYLSDSPHVLNELSVLFSNEHAYDIDLRGVFIILTSNFGANYSNPHISDAELDQRVHHLHSSTFDNHVLTDVPGLVALRPFLFEGFVEVLSSLLQEFYCDFTIAKALGPHSPYLLYDSQIPVRLARLAWEDGRRLRMGRNILDTFNQYIVGPLLGDTELRKHFPLRSDQIIEIRWEDDQGPEFSIRRILTI